jgi:choline kinase
MTPTTTYDGAPVRALILAAGRGSRMGSLTAEQPKCLTPIDGRRLLDRQLDALRGAGITELGLIKGYQGHLLPTEGLTHFENPRWASTQMVATLRCAAPWLASAPCIVSYSDILYGSEVITALAAAPGGLAISSHTGWRDIWSARFADPLSDAETFRRADDGRLLEIGGRATSLDQIEGQYMGLLRFTPAAWADVEALLNSLPPERQDRIDMTSLLNALLGAGVRIETVPVGGQWWEFDSEEDVRAFERITSG